MLLHEVGPSLGEALISLRKIILSYTLRKAFVHESRLFVEVLFPSIKLIYMEEKTSPNSLGLVFTWWRHNYEAKYAVIQFTKGTETAAIANAGSILATFIFRNSKMLIPIATINNPPVAVTSTRIMSNISLLIKL